MRPSLNQFERVEAYVQNTLPVQERLAFKAELSENPELQSLVEFQQQVIRAVNRQALRADIGAISSEFGQGGGGGHLPWKWIFSSLAVVIAGVAAYFAMDFKASQKNDRTERQQTNVAQPVAFASHTTLSSSNAADSTAFSTFKGLFPLFDVPGVTTGAVQDISSAGMISDRSYLEVVDFNELDFLPRGFARQVEKGMPFKSHTTADKRLCDSIYYTLRAFTRSAAYASDQNGFGKEGFVPGKGTAQLRGDRVIKGRIEVKEINTIPWAVSVTVVMNGKSSRKSIRVNRWGYFRFNKAEAGDAVIYFNGPSGIYKPDTMHVRIAKNGSKVTKLKAFALERRVGISKKMVGEMEMTVKTCSIDPLSVKVIRTSNFQQTFLATPAFEQRLAKLHTLPNGQELFELYVGNLGKNLYQVDSMVAARIKTAEQADFIAFSKQRLTNVKNRPNEKQLFAIYASKLTEASNQQQQLEKSYCKKVSKQIEQLEKKVDALSVKVAKATPSSAMRDGEEIYSPKTSTSRSESNLIVLESQFDRLIESSDAEDAFLQSLIEFLDPCFIPRETEEER